MGGRRVSILVLLFMLGIFMAVSVWGYYGVVLNIFSRRLRGFEDQLVLKEQSVAEEKGSAEA